MVDDGKPRFSFEKREQMWHSDVIEYEHRENRLLFTKGTNFPDNIDVMRQKIPLQIAGMLPKNYQVT